MPGSLRDGAFGLGATRWQAIRKCVDDLSVPPNLRDYEEARASFSWADARALLDGLPLGLRHRDELLQRRDLRTGDRTAVGAALTPGTLVEITVCAAK